MELAWNHDRKLDDIWPEGAASAARLVPSRRRSMLSRRLLLAFVSLALLLALGEIAARAFLAFGASDARIAKYGAIEQLRSRRDAMVTPHRYLGYVNTPNYRSGANEHDSRGFRGREVEVPKPEGEYRIVCLGGSTTYSTTVNDWRESYPAQLEAALHRQGHAQVRVVNAGVQGWSSFETMLSLPLRIFELEPDLLIVYHGVNEVPTRLVWPSAAYRPDNSGFRRHPPRFRERTGLGAVSVLARCVSIRAGWSPPTARLFDLDPFNETWVGEELDRQMWAGEYPDGLFAEVPAERIVEGNPPVHFRENLRTIIAMARSRSAEIVLATYSHLPPSDGVRDSSYHSLVFTQSIAQTNDVIREYGEVAWLFDYAAQSPLERRHYHTAMRGEREIVDIHHPNAEGYRMQAETFARFLVDRGAFDR